MRRVDPKHADKITRILRRLQNANDPKDMDVPGLDFHPLTGDQSGRFAVKVDKNWRITFGWSDADAIDVDYEDYH